LETIAISIQRIVDVLNDFEPISLPEMEAEMLMKRFDYKFKFHIKQLPGFLESVQNEYRVLEVNNLRLHKYESLYFDTENYLLYMQHQNVLRNRYKIRYRRYADSDLTFFEIKRKNNKELIIKERIRQVGIELNINEETGDFIIEKTHLDPDIFSPKLWVYYHRMTLVNKKNEERITIDIDPSFKMKGCCVSYPTLVIAEVKQKKYFRSPFVSVMRNNHFRKEEISKYCIGIALIEENIKQNHFKQEISSINKLCNENN